MLSESVPLPEFTFVLNERLFDDPKEESNSHSLVVAEPFHQSFAAAIPATGNSTTPRSQSTSSDSTVPPPTAPMPVDGTPVRAALLGNTGTSPLSGPASASLSGVGAFLPLGSSGSPRSPQSMMLPKAHSPGCVPPLPGATSAPAPMPPSLSQKEIPPPKSFAGSTPPAAHFCPHATQQQEEHVRVRNVYIAGLPLSLTEAGFATLMSSYGRVLSARLFGDKERMDGTGRAYGFALFETPDGAEHAVASLSGVMLQGNRVQARLSKNGVVRKPRVGAQPTPPAPRGYASNYPPQQHPPALPSYAAATSQRIPPPTWCAPSYYA